MSNPNQFRGDAVVEERQHYESPVLEAIGNVREILAGSTAGSPDGGDPPATQEVGGGM